jgi:hypothetical protein
MERIKLFENFEAKNPIDVEKLKRYSLGISICCAGEYGDVFYNEKENHIFVNLGDSNPFDDGYLEQYIKDAISKDYNSQKEIKVTIENECGPSGEGWKIYKYNKDEFVDWNGW